ncbi:MAG TPA: hypothetical protein PLL25_01025 [Flavobacteriales bacterium]|jgi:hypothetical protein|nr:hypothetical protein [Flavobacteriales bacterium]HOZ39358.1 hypothetical protein [Flavobacteriales bacterium]
MRVLAVFFTLFLSGGLSGQVVQRKHLITSYGAGVGLLTMSSPTEVLRSTSALAGSIRFAVGYAAGDRFSLGFHYERLGSTIHPGPVERFRVSQYHFEVSVRPVMRERWCIEFGVGVGPSIIVLSPTVGRLQPRANVGSVGFGLRYLRMLGPTLGVSIGCEITAAQEASLAVEAVPVLDERGQAVQVGWNAPRLGGGLVVRF